MLERLKRAKVEKGKMQIKIDKNKKRSGKVHKCKMKEKRVHSQLKGMKHMKSLS